MKMNSSVACSNPVSDTPYKNKLLSLIKANTRTNLYSRLSLVRLKRGEVLSQPGVTMNYFYFPTTCIVATLHLSENGDSTAISVIGNEGMTNIAHVLGAERTLHHEVVQSTGIAYRFSRSALMSDVQRDITLQPVLLRYAQSLLTQIAQTSVCNCHHQTPQRMCRLLLQLLDRLEGTSILMTHELIANMLGVRREGISDAANKLQQAGAIVSSRGKIVVLDRKILSSHCCECYEVVKEEELRLLASQNTMAKVTQYPARLGLR